jgi:hypothetical protein
MPKTKAECRDRALRKLGKLAIGQTAEAGIASDMEDAYDQIYARLDQLGLVTWSSTGSVPDEFVEDITAMMAFERSERVPDSRYARIRDDASRALTSISAYISGEYENPRDCEDF